MEAPELRLLSFLLGAPDEDSYELLRAVAMEFPWLEQPHEELVRLPLDQWQGEHTRLFIAGFPRTPCPPFASVWLEKRMHGASVESLLLLYRRLGLETAGMPADYLGTILECAALLMEEADEKALSAELWNNYLIPWLPDFTTALDAAAHLKIYRAMAGRLSDTANEYRMATADTPPA